MAKAGFTRHKGKHASFTGGDTRKALFTRIRIQTAPKILPHTAAWEGIARLEVYRIAPLQFPRIPSGFPRVSRMLPFSVLKTAEFDRNSPHSGSRDRTVCRTPATSYPNLGGLRAYPGQAARSAINTALLYIRR
jgi:hypothetical protein